MLPEIQQGLPPLFCTVLRTVLISIFIVGAMTSVFRSHRSAAITADVVKPARGVLQTATLPILRILSAALTLSVSIPSGRGKKEVMGGVTRVLDDIFTLAAVELASI